MDHGMGPVSAGELFDMVRILVIKNERMTDPEKLANVRVELALLSEITDNIRAAAPASVDDLVSRLKAVNEEIWEAEDKVRDFDRRGQFDAEFAAVARSTYRNNDRRAALKREINLLLGSSLIEEKSHAHPRVTTSL